MQADIAYSESAFKHGVTEDDIGNAFDTLLYDEAGVYDDSKFLAIGFDLSQNLIEIIYSIMDDGSICVFHVMKCRTEYLKYIER